MKPLSKITNIKGFTIHTRSSFNAKRLSKEYDNGSITTDVFLKIIFKAKKDSSIRANRSMESIYFRNHLNNYKNEQCEMSPWKMQVKLSINSPARLTTV